MTRRKPSLRIGESESLKWIVLSTIALVGFFMLAKAVASQPSMEGSSGFEPTILWR